MNRLLVPLLLSCLACGSANRGGRPLSRVRKDSAAIRSRALLDLERSLVFPTCDGRPSASYACGLAASREAERALVAGCGGDSACAQQGYASLFGKIATRADELGINLDAIDLRCGPSCRDLRELELEVLRTAHNGAVARTKQALLRADHDEREALELERENVDEFARDKKQRDQQVSDVIDRHRRSLDQASREGKSLPHVTLCSEQSGCPDARPCVLFSNAALGVCAKE